MSKIASGRIAFAWELGANYGHLSRTLPIAQELRTSGHDVLFAVRDIQVAESLLTPHGIAFVAAPRVSSPMPRDHRTALNYGRILADCGYASRELLRAQVRAWVNLWRLAAPAAVVIDHSPTALLAARVLAIPIMLLGTGFTIPPDRDPLPLLLQRHGASSKQLRESDRSVLGNINAALQAFAHPPLARLADMFAGLPAQITTFVDLDHYGHGARPGATFIGPVTTTQGKTRVEWTDNRSTKIFAYLRRGMPQLNTVLGVLKQADAEVICVIPDAPGALVEDLRKAGLRVFLEAVELAPLLAQASAVVTYGGAGMVAESLIAGVPLLMIPRFVEQQMSANRVAALGAGIVIEGMRSHADLAQALRRLLMEPVYRQSARVLAQKFAGFDAAVAAKQAARAIAGLARDGVSNDDNALIESARVAG